MKWFVEKKSEIGAVDYKKNSRSVISLPVILVAVC